MTSPDDTGCERPVSEVPAAPEPAQAPEPKSKEGPMQQVRVGHPAPKFTAPAWYNGGFTKVSLEEKLGHWLLVCFYPGDFTFV